MRHPPRAHLAGLLLAISTLGCVDRSYGITDQSGKLEVVPAYYGIDEGFPAVQFTAFIDTLPVAVTWESSETSVATVDANGMVTPLNDGFAAITATMTSNPSIRKSASFTVNELFGTPMASGVAVTGIAGAVGDMDLLYRIFVPEGSTNLTVTMTGGSGDFDLYVRRGPAIPNYDEFDCRPYESGNEEVCSIDDPEWGTWYLWIDVYTAGTGVSLTATVTAP
jgi:hypothetical protein